MSSNLCCMFFSILFCSCLIVYALILAKYKDVEHGRADPNIIPGPRATSTLKFLFVISRHGNRRLFGFPNDPYPMNNASYWPYETGELTTHGRMEMFKLGKKIRLLYDGYLNRDYGPSEIHASSTDMDRTVMSGQLFLAGLYPPQGVYIWNTELPWQPIPVYTDSLDNTPRILDCQRFLQERDKSLGKFRSENAMQLELIKSYLSEFDGTSISGNTSLVNVWDTFLSEDTEGYKLPEWSKEVYPEPLKDLASKRFLAFFGGSDQMVRLIVGQFIHQIMGVVKRKLNGTLSPDKKIYYYSGHDTTLLGVQLAFGIPQADVFAMPNPGSAVMIEIHQNQNYSIYTLQVFYIDGASSNLNPNALNIPDCLHPCEFTKLAEITSKFEDVTDFEEECKPVSLSNK